jgi:hypothetical protein
VDEREARELLRAELLALRALPHAELLNQFRAPVVRAVESPSGKAYQVEVTSFWDDRAARNLRVTVSIDDGGLRALWPLTDDFIIDPAGNFVGE